MKCIKGYEIRVLHSGAGFYIGTYDDSEGPNCRISYDYFKTKEGAEEALKTLNFQIRNCVENNFCNKGRRCF